MKANTALSPSWVKPDVFQRVLERHVLISSSIVSCILGFQLSRVLRCECDMAGVGDSGVRASLEQRCCGLRRRW